MKACLPFYSYKLILRNNIVKIYLSYFMNAPESFVVKSIIQYINCVSYWTKHKQIFTLVFLQPFELNFTHPVGCYPRSTECYHCVCIVCVRKPKMSPVMARTSINSGFTWGSFPYSLNTTILSDRARWRLPRIHRTTVTSSYICITLSSLWNIQNKSTTFSSFCLKSCPRLFPLKRNG